MVCDFDSCAQSLPHTESALLHTCQPSIAASGKRTGVQYDFHKQGAAYFDHENINNNFSSITSQSLHYFGLPCASHLRVLADAVSMSIQVEVLGDAFPQRSSTFDIYRPQLVRFEPFDDAGDNGDNIARHLDVVTTWKGISHEQAIELIFWERALQKSLESLIEETLISDFFLIDHDAGILLLNSAVDLTNYAQLRRLSPKPRFYLACISMSTVLVTRNSPFH